jgi:hypothetical protein
MHFFLLCLLNMAGAKPMPSGGSRESGLPGTTQCCRCDHFCFRVKAEVLAP